MAQGGRDSPHVFSIIDQQRSVQVAELVDAIEGQTLFLTKSLEPLIGLLEADGGSVLFGEQPPTLLPLIPQSQPLQGLLCPELFHQVEYPGGQFQGTAALGGFSGGCNNAVLGRVE